MADSAQFKKIKDIVLSDEARKVIVVSAPGKRFSGDNKITDLLFLIYSHVKYGVDPSAIFDMFSSRFCEISGTLHLKFDLNAELEAIRNSLSKDMSEDFLVSRGEYLTAKLMAENLGYEFVDSAEVIVFDYNGKINYARSGEKLIEKFEKYGRIVVPGFYGAYPNGMVKLFSRGGSDITGSVLSKLLKADLYENWTDVSGVMIADPHLVPDTLRVKEITYDELRELSYMGASVLHEETIFPVKDADIPINIRNTEFPSDEGTMILSKCSDNKQIITGITGKKGFSSITVLKNNSAKKIRVLMDVLSVLRKYRLNVEHIPTGIDTISIIIEKEQARHDIIEVLEEIKQVDGVTSVLYDDDIALLGIVGRNMVGYRGVAGAIFSALAENAVNVKAMAQGSLELSIVIGVSNEDFEKSIRAIYRKLIK